MAPWREKLFAQMHHNASAAADFEFAQQCGGRAGQQDRDMTYAICPHWGMAWIWRTVRLAGLGEHNAPGHEVFLNSLWQLAPIGMMFRRCPLEGAAML